MARRLEVELTSTREDGTWTWRAAGARQPKGDVAADLLYTNATVGDVVRVEAEFHLDGIEIIEVFPPKKKQERSDILERKLRPLRDDELVSEVRAPGGRKGGGRRDRRNSRDDDRGDRGDRPRGNRRQRPEQDDRPKPKRLRPGRTHRDAILAEIPDEHRPIADQILQGGLPAVRAAVDKQNDEAASSDKPKVEMQPVLAIAEPLVAKLRTAEWHDRAEAALAGIDEVDLRDLRSVVVAADAGARDEETRALAEQLRTALNERVENDHRKWLQDVQAAVDEGRTVRALRLSSRPVKAGAPLPVELANRLAAAASAALAGDVFPDRWATVLDALAFTPIRSAVTPSGFPTDPPAEFLDAVRRVADRVPEIAAHYGIDPSEAEKARKNRPRRNRSGRDRQRGDKPKQTSPRDLPPVPGAEKPVEEAPPDETTADEATAEAPEVSTPGGAGSDDTATDDTATDDTATDDTATDDAATAAE